MRDSVNQRRRFDRRTLALRLVEWLDARRARRGEANGDQGPFFRSNLLRSAGGFPHQPIMEDVELSRRMRSLGTPAYLDVPAVVSARRFERLGWPRVLWTNWLLRRRYRREGLAACMRLRKLLLCDEGSVKQVPLFVFCGSGCNTLNRVGEMGMGR
jgi:hypothetical protein